ncbi:hypothetical protein INR77_05045 [Erythrobacter sp. SCSIO 43205]|uniref:hypothetical protein n=1 Tax=Erythrobacter sp. SCSIO 43205 TaxID=2779361 RepID=UPI001CA806E7|nr:hypothetical protein [Erythrobacter sp. SCSIO 43205]UAB79058.1 hypothetical protein INR77_05045 [Erythrobacter sp. SCSIO 43205]
MRRVFDRFGLAVWFALLLTSLGIASPASARTDVENAPDPYVHKATNVALPENIPGFRRHRVVEFDADGRDTGIVYRPTDRRGEITLYVYPRRGESCEESFAGADAAVMRRGASVLTSEDVFSMKEFTGATQISRSYIVEPSGYGFEHDELVSFLYVACPASSAYMVKYRGSYPSADAAKNIGIEQKLFAGIDWGTLSSR